MQKTRYFEKIDSEGNYTKFPGVTVVAAIRTQDFDLWKEIYNEVSKCTVTKEHYSLLPWESYHMTTNNLHCHRDYSVSEWHTFIEKNLPVFQKIHALTIEKTFNPEITIDKLYTCDRVIYLELKLLEDHHSIVKSVAQSVNTEDKIPPEFHITLGYAYKPVDDATLEVICQELKTNLTCFGKTYTLDPPKICHFDDMTAFIPYDFQKSPFITNNNSQ